MLLLIGSWNSKIKIMSILVVKINKCNTKTLAKSDVNRKFKEINCLKIIYQHLFFLTDQMFACIVFQSDFSEDASRFLKNDVYSAGQRPKLLSSARARIFYDLTACLVLFSPLLGSSRNALPQVTAAHSSPAFLSLN